MEGRRDMEGCEFQQVLARYHDGELPPEERHRCEDHLSTCEECAAELERLRALSGLLNALEAPPMPAGMLVRVQERIRPVRELEIIRICRVAAAAAAAVLAVCSIWLWQSPPAEAGEPVAPATWEIVAVTGSAELAQTGGDQEYALWIAESLSPETGP
jgi:anti-sigma factor RsiW